MITSTKESMEKAINKYFSQLEDKTNDIENFIYGAECDIPDPNLKIKLLNAEIQINKILQDYSKLSKNELTIEEIYRFATYLTNIFKKADKIANIKVTFNVDKRTIDTSINLMQSSDIHDKVIGIDNFMVLTHTNSTLLPDFLAIVNGVGYKYNVGYYLIDEDIDKLFEWRSSVSDKIINKLNEIRTQKGLSKFRYENI